MKIKIVFVLLFAVATLGYSKSPAEEVQDDATDCFSCGILAGFELGKYRGTYADCEKAVNFYHDLNTKGILELVKRREMEFESGRRYSIRPGDVIRPHTADSLPTSAFTNMIVKTKFEYVPQSLKIFGAGTNAWLTLVPKSTARTETPYHWTNVVICLTQKPIITQSNGCWLIEFKK